MANREKSPELQNESWYFEAIDMQGISTRHVSTTISCTKVCLVLMFKLSYMDGIFKSTFPPKTLRYWGEDSFRRNCQ